MTHRGTVELAAPRLRLRRLVPADAGSMFRHYATDGRVTRFLSWQPYERVEDVATFLEGQIAAYARDDFYHWAIEIGGQMVGSISAIAVDERNHSCEVGYCIGYDFWGKGYMSEALQAVLAFFFREVGLHRVMARHDVGNPASGRVMAKCGMRPEGRLRGHCRRWDGTYGDSLVYGILREDFLEHPR